MAAQGTIWHSSLADGITADWQKLGENVGTGGTVDGLETAFVNSPHHYDNLVDPAFRSIGIGVVRNAAGTLFVAEEFMQDPGRAAAPAPAGPAGSVVGIVAVSGGEEDAGIDEEHPSVSPETLSQHLVGVCGPAPRR